MRLGGPRAARCERRAPRHDVLLQPRDRIFVFDSESRAASAILGRCFDELRLQSRIDRPMQIVGVGGRVKAPGRYPLEQGMRVSDLIRAGGSLEEAAYGGQAELTRHRVIDGEYRQIDLVGRRPCGACCAETPAPTSYSSPTTT